MLCRTDQEVSPPHKGLSMLLVETDRPGFEATDVGTKMGWKASSTCEIVFKNVRVPVSNLLGTENRGFYHAMELFTETRIDVAANSLGGAQAAFDWSAQGNVFSEDTVPWSVQLTMSVVE